MEKYLGEDAAEHLLDSHLGEFIKQATAMLCYSMMQ